MVTIGVKFGLLIQLSLLAYHTGALTLNPILV